MTDQDLTKLPINPDTLTVSAKNLHQVLGIKKDFSTWFRTYQQLFAVKQDYVPDDNSSDYQLNIPMAQYIAIIGRTEKGREVNQYLFQYLQHLIDELRPKAAYYDLVLQCEDLVSATTIAKDYGMSARSFNIVLSELGIQYKQGGLWYLYAKYQGQGYMKGKTHNYAGKEDRIHAAEHKYWTHKGRLFLYQYLKQQGIVPLNERPDVNQEAE